MEEGKLQTTSTAYMLLEHLFFIGAATRKDMSLCMSETRRNPTITRAFNIIKSKAYIKLIKGTKDVYELSAKGLNCLADSEEYYYENRKGAQKVIPSEVAKSSVRNSIQFMLVGADVTVYKRYKPPLAQLACVMNGESVPPSTDFSGYWKGLTTENCVELLKQRVYYSPREVRDYLRSVGGEEQTYRSRFHGVVLTERDIYILYHSKASLIKWTQDSEQTTVDALIGLFSKYLPYTRYISDNRCNNRPICVFLGKRYALAPALAMGFIHGRIRNKNSLNNEIAQKKLKLMSARNTLFDSMFYVPVMADKVNELSEVLFSDTETLAAEAEGYFTRTKGFLARRRDSAMKGDEQASNLPAVYCPNLELKRLYELRNGEHRVVVCSEARIADTISHILGPHMAKIYDISTAKEITDITRYDIYGYPTNKKDIYEELSKKFKGIKKTEEKVQISVRLTYKEFEQFRQEAIMNGLSLNGYANLILRKHLTNKDEGADA